MTRYEEEFDTDWADLDADEATDRAYAIGVAERFGQPHREELERIYEDAETGYEQSMIELAYREGRREAEAAAAENPGDSPGDIWAELVAAGPPAVEEEALTGGREGLPEALDSTEMLDRAAPDSTEALDRPEFLDR